MPATKTKTILILAANPSDTTRLRLPAEERDIREGLALADGHHEFEVVSQWAVRPDDLRRALLKYEPQIVHFSGHGEGEDGLLFETDSGQGKAVSTASLSRLLRLCSSVDCVVLNACFSQVQADAIVQHVDYVVGMNNSIGDRAALKFAVGFYDALGYGRSVPEAYEFGLAAIELEGVKGSDIPMLAVRAETEGSPPSAASASTEEEASTKVDTGQPDLQVEEQPPNPATDAAEESLPPATGDLVLEEPEGLVPLDSPFYVERSPIESDCYDAVVRPYALIRIKAPRQLGKTSLLTRTLAHAQTQGFETVRLSFESIDSTALSSLDEFLQWFCSSVTEELDLEDRLADYWTGARGLVRRCQRYFEKYLLKALDGPLVLGLDDVDLVFEHADIATDFFGMLRVWHEEGKTSALWRKLHLVIAHSKEVYVPLSINRSPFNVGLPIELRQLNTEEIESLIERHQLALTPHQKQQLVDVVGGHPYLLRKALYQLARGRMTLTKLLSEAPTEGGLYNDHLRRHLLHLEAGPELLAAFKEVIRVYQSVQIGSTEAFKLNSMGLVRYEGNAVVPLCGLYRQYFHVRLR